MYDELCYASNMEQPTPSNSNSESPRFTGTRIVKSLKAKADAQRSFPERVADWMTATFGTITFFAVNCLFFLIWLVVNTNIIPGVVPFDPFPFGLLTTIVSLEAIILAIFVLISQNRASKVDDIREETDLHVDVITEQEITKLLELVSMLAQKQGIDLSQDKRLQEMLKPTDLNKLERQFTKELGITHEKHK